MSICEEGGEEKCSWVFFDQSSYENNWDTVKITINLGELVKKLFGFILSKNGGDS